MLMGQDDYEQLQQDSFKSIHSTEAHLSENSFDSLVSLGDSDSESCGKEELEFEIPEYVFETKWELLKLNFVNLFIRIINGETENGIFSHLKEIFDEMVKWKLEGDIDGDNLLKFVLEQVSVVVQEVRDSLIQRAIIKFSLLKPSSEDGSTTESNSSPIKLNAQDQAPDLPDISQFGSEQETSTPVLADLVAAEVS